MKTDETIKDINPILDNIAEPKRESFVFYRSFNEAISECEESEQLIIYKAISNYALDRVEPELSGIAKICWSLIKPQLDANWKRFDNGCKGGCPSGIEKPSMRGNKNALKQNQNKTKTKPKQNLM